MSCKEPAADAVAVANSAAASADDAAPSKGLWQQYLTLLVTKRQSLAAVRWAHAAEQLT